MFSFFSPTLNKFRHIYFLPNLCWCCVIAWGLWPSDRHVAFQHIIHQNHPQLDRSVLVSTCGVTGLDYYGLHNNILFLASYVVVCLQEYRTEEIHSIHDIFQNMPNLCVQIWWGRIHLWIIGEYLTFEFYILWSTKWRAKIKVLYIETRKICTFS